MNAPRPGPFRRALRWARLALLAFSLLVTLGLTVSRWMAGRRETEVATAAAPASGRFVAAGDVQMFVQEAGDPAAPAVLFVHGTGAWSETWRPTMEVVAAAGFRALAIDLPPFGYSQRPQPPRYAKADQGRRIVAALDSLGLQRTILVGHSFGGGPTVEAALLRPERVPALVLVDAALSIHDPAAPDSRPPAVARMGLKTRPFRDSVVAAFFSNPRFTRRLLLSFIADPAAATPERVAIYQRPLTLQGTTRAFGEWLPELVAPAAPSRSEDPAAYAALGLPLAVIWGDRDTITPLEQGRRLASLAPGATLDVLPGVGHIPQIEDPRAFHEALVRVLRRVRPG
jgi:pimeloyl-ACP methyl ester carboxylesterase